MVLKAIAQKQSSKQSLSKFNSEAAVTRCSSTYVFSCEYCEIFQNSFFYRTPPVAAFVSLMK